MANIRVDEVDFFAHESVTVSGTSKALTEATYSPTQTLTAAGHATYVLITVEGDQIRWWADGADADANGHRANVDDVIELQGFRNIKNFRAIRVTLDATLRVSYARRTR